MIFKTVDGVPVFGVSVCGRFVIWWDGEYECELHDGHDGPHFDGMSWFNDDGEEVFPDD